MSLAVNRVDSPLGPLLIAADDEAIRLIEFASEERSERQLARVSEQIGQAAIERDSPLLARLVEELDAYFAGSLTQFTVPWRTCGTAFQQRVWRELAKVPCGQTRSYAAMARAIGQPKAVRAVGTANGANPISIVLPCHRIVRSGGALGGYGGGLDRKRWLLDHERAHAAQKPLAYAV